MMAYNKSVSKLCIFGIGGSGREILTCLIDHYKTIKRDYKELILFMVDDEYYSSEEVMGVKVIRMSEFNPIEYEAIVGLGDPVLRKKIVEKLPHNTKYATIIHPSAIISDWIEIGEGSIITAGCIFTCNIKIGKHAQINLSTTIGHDCQIGDFFTTAQGANISGNCTFGECVYLGANAVIKQKISVCANSVIGMGGVVVKNVEEPGVYVGNPIRKIK